LFDKYNIVPDSSRLLISKVRGLEKVGVEVSKNATEQAKKKT
jgi:hypothetical protein